MMDNQRARMISNAVLSTVDLFLGTCPDLQEAEIKFEEERLDGESPSVRMLRMKVDGEPFLIMCKREG